MEIEGNYVDYVVVVDKIGIPEKIVSGTTQITKSPDRLLIAELTASFLEKSGILKDGVNNAGWSRRNIACNCSICTPTVKG